MPDRFGAGKATSIGPDPGSPDLPKTGQDLLNNGSIMDIIRALGLDDVLGTGRGGVKRLASGTNPADLLGEVLTMPKTTTSDGLSLPKRVRVSSIDPSKGSARLHGANMTGTPMDVSSKDVGSLYDNGVLSREVPPSEGMGLEQLADRLAKVLGKMPKE